MDFGKWIWKKGGHTADSYVEFRSAFVYDGSEALLRIAAETDYIAYINGKRVSFMAFAGYGDEKYYDEVDITGYCLKGENVLTVTARYEGRNTATHIDDGAGLIFEVVSGEDVLCFSSEKTLCRIDERYVQGVCRLVTGQLGYSSNMKNAESGEYENAVPTGRNCVLKKRPVERCDVLPGLEGKNIHADGKMIFDLGREECGYVYLSVNAEEDTLVKVAYGEHIFDGEVMRLVGGRDFSLDFHCKKGENSFEQMFVRIAGRYLQIICDDPIEVVKIGIYPVMYPLTEKKRSFDGLYGDIYKTCVRTLRLCMHTHYEDCPWREQALYVLDSKNQMMCGYYAFEETAFQRANLVFILKGKREDGLLELTYPAVNTPAIPFFSIMYPVEVCEYIDATGDRSVIDEVKDTVEGIFNAFRRYKNGSGLISNPPAPYWNFYEWTDNNDGRNELHNPAERKEKTDLILNCAYVISLITASKYFGFDTSETDKMKEEIRRRFYNEEKGMYCTSSLLSDDYSQLGQAFAVLAGLDGRNVVSGCKGEGNVTPASLSMLGFVYDALLNCDSSSKKFILDDIKSKYGYMLSKGATSFWETINGESDFGNAGSLCHGWSAIPIKYLCELL